MIAVAPNIIDGPVKGSLSMVALSQLDSQSLYHKLPDGQVLVFNVDMYDAYSCCLEDALSRRKHSVVILRAVGCNCTSPI